MTMTRTDWWAICETNAFTPRTLCLIADLFADIPIQSAQELIDLTIPHALYRSALTKDAVYEAYERASRQLFDCEKQGIQTLAITDADFPARLKAIPDPPLRLYIRGNIDLLHTTNGVALIGTRKPTDHGQELAYQYGQALAQAQKVVVSGLALGCDTGGHQGCLEVKNGRTVAFLPGSVVHIYPAENRNLAENILASDGVLVSEYPPDTSGLLPVHHFIDRDRLQAGLAQAILVIETDVKGGSMHTVRFAEKQGNRPIAVADSHPDHLRHEKQVSGNRLLLRHNRATPIYNDKDLKKWLKTIPQFKSSKQGKLYVL